MPAWLAFLLYVIAFVSFLLAAFAPEWTGRINAIGLGLAAWVLVELVNAWPD